MRILLLYNPVAGGGRSLTVLEQARIFLEKEGIDTDSRTTANSASDTEPNWQHYERVWLIGGDGTLHRLLNTWGPPPIALSLISGGSGNDFSRLVQDDTRQEVQFRQALSGKEERIDLGTCNGVWFATGVGMGFDGSVADILQRNFRMKGFLSYYLVVILQIFRYREKHISIKGGAFNWEGKSLLFTVGNGSDFGGGFKVTPDASFRDGIFQCCLITRVPLLSRILHLSKVQKGKHRRLSFVRFFDSGHLNIRCETELVCHMDGEVYRWKEFEISMQEGALLVRV